jgi:outer membrane protein OmpA-like peptidoglycan-associated protein
METEKAQDSNDAQTNNTGPNAPNGLIAEAQAVIDSSKLSATAEAHSTQTRSSLITTSLISLIVFLLFVMLMLSISSKSSQSLGGSEGLTALELNNDQLRAKANAERARNGLPPLPPSSASAFTTAERLRKDAKSLASLASNWEAELETKNAVIGELQAQQASRDEMTRELYTKIATLQNQANQSAGAASQLIILSEDLQTASDQIEKYRIQIGELQGRPSNDQLSDIRKQLNESLSKNGKLQLQIDDLLKAANSTSSSKIYDEALTEIENLRGDNHKQRYEVQRLRAELDHPALFIKSDKDLPAEAARLYAKLTTLEDADQQQLASAYEDIRKTMNAQIIHRQTFTKGSSRITFDREKIIQDILDKRQDRKSLFLVIGYASASGKPDSNRELSAKRATTVASIVKMLKAEDQQVKAVYLGETKRFSPDTEIKNQICEIWEIKI